MLVFAFNSKRTGEEGSTGLQTTWETSLRTEAVQHTNSSGMVFSEHPILSELPTVVKQCIFASSFWCKYTGILPMKEKKDKKWIFLISDLF